MLARISWLIAFVLTACVRDDPDHCANQDGDGDAYCSRIEDAGNFCSKCTADGFGCVDAAPALECRPDNATSVAEGGSTSDPSATSPTSDTIADDSATSTSASATTVDGSSSESTGPTMPVCGNEILEMGEVCDGTDLGGFDCEASGHDGGTLACDQETCEFDYTGCSSQVSVCGDGVINQASEECDISDFDDANCDMQPGHGAMGTLACNDDCTIDASACCLDNGEPCQRNADCCINLCDILGSGTCGLG